MARATVVIPNWNGLAHLEACLASLRGQTLAHRAILVDNASSDGSVAFVRESFPEVEVVQMPENGGFSYAVNEGIRRSDTEYVALLNNDTELTPEWLAELVRALDERPDFDIAASKLVLYYDREKINAAGDEYDYEGLHARHRGYGCALDTYPQPEQILGACAGAALYRRSLFDLIGLFDERFFLLAEDTDVNLRAMLAGRKAVYVPSSVLYHKHHVTIDEQPREEMAFLGRRNEAAVIAKDFPAPIVARVLARWMWRTFRDVFPLKPWLWGQIPANWRTAREVWRPRRAGFRMGLAHRRQVQRTRKVSSAYVLAWLKKGRAEQLSQRSC